MKLSRLHTMLVGTVIMIAGIGLFLDAIHLIEFSVWNLWPVILLYFGLNEWSKGKQLAGGILTGLGTIFVLSTWFNLHLDDVFGLLLSIGFLYFGFQLIRARKGKDSLRSLFQPYTREKKSEYKKGAASFHPEHAADTAEPFATMKMRLETPGNKNNPKNCRSALIGDFHLTSGRFELTHLDIWHGIGNVVIDLSRAVIREDEACISIKGWIGDITIYVPVDMPISVGAEVMIGDLGIFGHQQGGFNRSVLIRSDSYDTAKQKVTLNISLILGDIDVKYI